MANHKSSLKRIRQEQKRRLHNRYYGKTMRNAVRKLRLAKKHIIHKNKANNLKSKLALHINKLA